MAVLGGSEIVITVRAAQEKLRRGRRKKFFLRNLRVAIGTYIQAAIAARDCICLSAKLVVAHIAAQDVWCELHGVMSDVPTFNLALRVERKPRATYYHRCTEEQGASETPHAAERPVSARSVRHCIQSIRAQRARAMNRSISATSASAASRMITISRSLELRAASTATAISASIT